jgi:Mycobacterium 19 kDa lipoprotein antigen
MSRLLRAAGAALVAMGGVSGCASESHPPPERNAQVTIGGDTRTVPNIVCHSMENYRTVDIGEGAASIEAVVVFNGTTISPEWVKISNFGGFTGSAWKGGVGSAQARIDGDAFVITGDAYGAHTRDSKPAMTNFRIVANCR